MKLNCKSLFIHTGEIMPIDLELPIEEFGTFQGFELAAPPKCVGTIRNHAGIVELSIATEFILAMQCDRCTEKFEQSFKITTERTVVRECEQEHDDYLVTEDGWVDLTDLTIVDLLLELPTKILCKEECKGLCVQCGCNWNVSECDCIK